ncbi:MAG TPA: arsenate reductase (glutaredoxin) [Methylophaga sp.]|nr:arsenate reductase (glutaredoxin) [Methylophaga sp.]
MSQTRIYHNPRCSKSRQTLAILSDHNENVEIIEYLKQPPSPAELTELTKKLAISPRQLLRKTEAEYKELGLNNAELSDAELLEIMSQHPKLIERPIVVKNGKARIGRPPEVVTEIL